MHDRISFSVSDMVQEQDSRYDPVIFSPVKFPDKAHELARVLEILGQDMAL